MTERAIPAIARRVLRRQVGWDPEARIATGIGLSMPLVILLALWVVVPFVRLVVTALGPPKGAGNISSYFTLTANLIVLRTTFVDALIVTIICVLLGSVLAWSLRTTSWRATRLLALGAIFVPFLMGSVIKAYAFEILLQRVGVVNRVLLDLHLISQPLNLLYNQFAVILGMIYQMLPYATIPAYVAFLSIDLDLVRTAESLGAPRWRAVISVVTPLALPGVLATTVIVYVISLGFYLTPVILGGAAVPFSANLIDADIFTFYDLSDAAVSALVLMVGAIIAVAIGYSVLGKERLERALG